MNTTSHKMPMILVTITLVMGLLYACSDADSGGDSTPSGPPTLTAGDITYASVAQGTADNVTPQSSKINDFSVLTFSIAPIGTYSGTGTQVPPTIAEDGTITVAATTTAGSYRVTITPDGSTYAGDPLTVDFYVTVTATDLADLDTKLQTAITNYGSTGDFNYIDTSAVTDMSFLFAPKYTPGGNGTEDSTRTYVEGFNGDISKWNVSNVEKFSYMFSGATAFNQDIGGWNVAKGINFNWMFSGATAFNQDIGDWTVSAGEDFSSMFSGAKAFNQDIGGWNVAKGTNFNGMFFQAVVFNQDIGNWVVSKGTEFSSMFYEAIAFNQDIGGWTVSFGTEFSYMFRNATAFNQDISGWNVAEGKNFNNMFEAAVVFNQDISGWNVAKGENFSSMFSGAKAFNQDLSGWEVQPTATKTSMFRGSGMENSPPAWYQ